MSKKHDDKKIEDQLPEVFRGGEQLLVPEHIELLKARDAIQSKLDWDEEPVAIDERIDGFWWDAALALWKSMCNHFSWVFQKPTPRGWFGSQPPQLTAVEIGIENGKKQYIKVPTGRFTIPGVDGYIETGHGHDEISGMAYFQLTGQVRRKHEHVIRKIAETAREIVAKQSMYKAKTMRVRFKTDDGQRVPFPRPEFVDVSNAEVATLILNRDVKAAVETNIFTPILHTHAVRNANIPLKRGVLLAGPYGTGKTLTAYTTAHLAEKNGWTFLYCDHADELADVVRFARYYAPAVIFCEDIDSTMSGERSVEMNDVLNIIDGIESKEVELMFILTTNHVERLNKAFLRPGRLDAVIPFATPDAETAGLLVAHYGQDLIDSNVDLMIVGEALKGQIPAMIRECVERAKLSNIRVHGGASHKLVSQDALLDAASGMSMQMKLLDDRPVPPTTMDEALATIGKFMAASTKGETDEVLHKVGKMVAELHKHII